MTTPMRTSCFGKLNNDYGHGYGYVHRKGYREGFKQQRYGNTHKPSYRKVTKKEESITYDGVLYEFVSTGNEGNMVTGSYRPHPVQPIKLSSHLFDKVYLKENIPEGMYILGIKYCEHKDGDTQVTVTGKAKIDEKLHDAYNREIMEEVGVQINSFENPKEHLLRLKSFPVSTIVVDINNITAIVPTEKKYSDDSDLRVQVCIYGLLEDFARVLSSVTHKIKEETDIEGIVLFPKDVLEHVPPPVYRK